MSTLVESASALLPEPRDGSPPPGLLPGDVATLVVRAAWEGGTLRFPSRQELETALQGKAAVLDDGADAPAGVAELHAASGASTGGRAWKVQLLLPPGEHELPAVPVSFEGEQAPEGGALEVPGPSVTIGTVLAAEEAQALTAAEADAERMKAEVAQRLDPARGPWELAPRVPWWIWLLAALAAAALLAWAVARWRKRRRLAPPPPVRLDPPEVVARRRLAGLREGALLSTGRHLEFHVALADILKEYLERRWDHDLRERTTDEIRRLLHGPLRGARQVPEVRQDVLAVLSACDLVKFAKVQPVPSEALAHVETVERLVTRTTESAPAAQQPDAPGRAA